MRRCWLCGSSIDPGDPVRCSITKRGKRGMAESLGIRICIGCYDKVKKEWDKETEAWWLELEIETLESEIATLEGRIRSIAEGRHGWRRLEE